MHTLNPPFASIHDARNGNLSESENAAAVALSDIAGDARIIQSCLEGLGDLGDLCHGLAVRSGWWGGNGRPDPRDNPLCFSNKLMLIVSEVSEAMEGDRKSMKDDKLPHRDMREVELADALIRIFDLAGAYGLDLAGATIEKLAFNQQRPDHKVENREAEGGKVY